MSIDPTLERSPRKPLRLWPGVVAVALQWLIRFVLPVLVPATANFAILGGLAFAMNGIASGQGVTTTVPFGSFGKDSDGGSVLKWDNAKSQRLFQALAHDTTVPQDVITNTQGG